MESNTRLQNLDSTGRQFEVATSGDSDLGPLQNLPGRWVSEGRGWNMIALPFAGNPKLNYRLLMNQYDEELVFSFVDKGVPNRGISDDSPPAPKDQLVVTLDYEQRISQVAAEDFPVSGKAGHSGLAVHHEPGLWLHMLNHQTNALDIARLASIPHGDSVLAIGKAEESNQQPLIPKLSGLPFGVGADVQNNRHLAPYKHFIDNPFFGTVPAGLPGFPGFHPDDLNAILNFANNGLTIKSVTVLDVDSEIETGGIKNIPFIVRQANAASMKSTFWIQEIDDGGGRTRLRLQYSQIVMLDFFTPRRDGMPGPIRWPHVSINTLDKVSDAVA